MIIKYNLIYINYRNKNIDGNYIIPKNNNVKDKK